jgi:hypothetical protein
MCIPCHTAHHFLPCSVVENECCFGLRWEKQLFNEVKIKIKLPLYRPGQTGMFPGIWGSQKCLQSTNEIGELVSPMHRPSYPHEIYLVLISVGSWVSLRNIVRPEGFCQWKIPMTPSGIEPVTFRLAGSATTDCNIAWPYLMRSLKICTFTKQYYDDLVTEDDILGYVIPT